MKRAGDIRGFRAVKSALQRLCFKNSMPESEVISFASCQLSVLLSALLPPPPEIKCLHFSFSNNTSINFHLDELGKVRKKKIWINVMTKINMPPNTNGVQQSTAAPWPQFLKLKLYSFSLWQIFFFYSARLQKKKALTSQQRLKSWKEKSTAASPAPECVLFFFSLRGASRTRGSWICPCIIYYNHSLC